MTPCGRRLTSFAARGTFLRRSTRSRLGRMTDFIRAEELLPAVEIDAIIHAPANLIRFQDVAAYTHRVLTIMLAVIAAVHSTHRAGAAERGGGWGR